MFLIRDVERNSSDPMSGKDERHRGEAQFRDSLNCRQTAQSGRNDHIPADRDCGRSREPPAVPDRPGVSQRESHSRHQPQRAAFGHRGRGGPSLLAAAKDHDNGRCARQAECQAAPPWSRQAAQRADSMDHHDEGSALDEKSAHDRSPRSERAAAPRAHRRATGKHDAPRARSRRLDHGIALTSQVKSRCQAGRQRPVNKYGDEVKHDRGKTQTEVNFASGGGSRRPSSCRVSPSCKFLVRSI